MILWVGGLVAAGVVVVALLVACDFNWWRALGLAGHMAHMLVTDLFGWVLSVGTWLAGTAPFRALGKG